MKIDKNTRYADFALFEPLMAEGMGEALERAAVEEKFGKDGLVAMTLGDMFSVLAGDPKPLTGDDPESVFAVYRVKAFQRFMGDGKDNGFISQLKRLTLPATPESIRVSQGCLDYAFDESVYVFCRSYFNLHTFADVDNLKVADLILAKRDAYNQAIVDRNMAADIKKGARA